MTSEYFWNCAYYQNGTCKGPICNNGHYLHLCECEHFVLTSAQNADCDDFVTEAHRLEDLELERFIEKARGL
jgi:hypothetical protein